MTPRPALRLLGRWPSWWVPLALVLLYLPTRLINLGALPMVSDEGTYVTWGVRALYGQGIEDWLASLEDGKQPLLAWLMPPFLALSPDRLIAGRLVSVATGLANLLLLVALGRRLYGRPAGWIAGLLYVVAPIALVHDRMALYESLVTLAALAALAAALAWAERPTAGRTGALGLAMGLALLTKLSALFFVILVPVVVALWRRKALRQWWPLAQAYFLAAGMYSVLYLSPIIDNISEGNFDRYSLTAGEVLQAPFALWGRNVTFVVEAATVYLGWPLTLLAAAAVLVGAFGGGRPGRVAAVWTLVPLALFVLTAKLIYSRYVVFCFVGALLPAAGLLVALAHQRLPPLPLPRVPAAGRTVPLAAGVAALVTLVAVVPGLAFGARLLADPASAPWMDDKRFITDRFQYVESNYAGYGLREIVDHLRAQAAHGPVVVLARNTTGMPRDGVTAYLLDWPNVHVGFVPEHEGIEQRLQREPDRAYLLAAQGADLYYVLSDAPNGEQERRFRSLNPGLAPLMEIPKPGNHSRFQLYRTRLSGPAADTWLDPPVRFGREIALRGFRLDSAAATPGGTLRLVLYWEALAQPARNYTVFNHMLDHMLDGSATIWGQHDGQPADGQRPSSRWRAGDLVADVHDIAVRPDTPPGTYDLITGLYERETLQRLPVEREGAAPSNHVVLLKVSVAVP